MSKSTVVFIDQRSSFNYTAKHDRQTRDVHPRDRDVETETFNVKLAV